MIVVLMLRLFTHDPCKQCIYYHASNNTCQIKKCCTGGYGYVSFLDRLCCSPCRNGRDDNEQRWKNKIVQKENKP